MSGVEISVCVKRACTEDWLAQLCDRHLIRIRWLISLIRHPFYALHRDGKIPIVCAMHRVCNQSKKVLIFLQERPEVAVYKQRWDRGFVVEHLNVAESDR